MDINKFEKDIQRAFEQHRPETDNDALWENIEPHLKKKKKRRGIILLFWGLGLGLLLLFGWIGWRQSAKVWPGEAAPMSTRTLDAPRPMPKASALPKEPAAATNLPGFENLEGLPQKIEAKFDDRIKREHVTATAAETPGTTEAVDTPVIADLVQPLLPAQPAQPQQDSAENTTERLAETPSATETPTEAESETERMPPTPPPADETDSSKKKKKKTCALTGWKIPQPDWTHYWGIQGGPMLVLKQLKVQDNLSAPAGYLAARKATESSLEAFSAGIRYAPMLGKHVVLNAGLDYRQINERFHLAYTTLETLQQTGVLTQTVNAAGAVIGQTVGPKTVVRKVEYAQTVYNHYRFVYLPLGVGYRQMKRKHFWEITAGTDINLFFRVSGVVYNRYQQPIILRHDQENYAAMFRRRASMGLWAGYTYGARLRDNLYWQTGVQLQTALAPVTQPEYELTQRYIQFGAQAGLLYRIEKKQARLDQ